MRSPVTTAYERVRLINRSMSYSRYLRIATPMLRGREGSAIGASALSSRQVGEDVLAFGVRSGTAPITNMPAPAIAHLSWGRRSPVELSLIHISEPTRRTPISYAV